MIHDVNHSCTTFLHTNPHFAQRNPGRAMQCAPLWGDTNSACMKNTVYFSYNHPPYDISSNRFPMTYPCPQTTFKYLGSAGLISIFSRKCLM